MKVVSWNVNGLAACKRKGFLKFLAHAKPDVFCCQEIKTQCPLHTPDYLQFWNPAQRKGYSGTLTLTRKQPLSVHYGLGMDEIDREGRVIALEYDTLYIINVYVPNSQGSAERHDFRVLWDEALLEYLKGLDKPIVLCGDFNVARDYIDIYPENLRNEQNPPGFELEEREGMERLLDGGFTDVFRTLYPDQTGAYTWWSNRLNKRLENRGWRLDYFLISNALMGNVRDVVHHTDVLGSDHCPISLTLRLAPAQKGLTQEDLAAMWRGIDWDRMEDQLLELQRRLARASLSRQWDQVTELQKRLVRSLAAKTLAVRHVVQVGSEAGIDGVKWHTDEDKMRAALSLTSKGYHARPYRRIVIQDEGKERRINIPTAYDKAMQALYAYSLDPVAESLADKKSFAFRKGRSMNDAHAYICQVLSGGDAPRWIVRADVRACYDTISHNWLLKHIPMDKKILREFLRAGAVFGGELFPTNQGISQGATLSPVLGNMVLDGLQAYLYDGLHPNGVEDFADGNMIRFADDIIITARTADSARRLLELLDCFLAQRGLMLHPDKSYLTNVTLGFEFLSRQYRLRDGIFTAKPSDRAVKDFERRLENFILKFHGSQKTLIERLNRKLIGWANYHRITDAYEAFRRIDTVVQTLLARKMRMLHPKRQWKHIVKRYWKVNSRGKHIFALQNKPSVHVIRLVTLNIVEHQAIRTSFHPYLDQEYYIWLQRKRDVQKVSGAKHRAIWQRQSGRCHYCGAPMLPDQEITLVETMIGGGRRVENLAYIHQRCAYDVLTDGPEGEHLDLISMLETVTDPIADLESPYWDLREFFRNCKKSPVTLTFQQIEQIIGDNLDWEAYFSEAFWFDEAPGMTSELWDDFPFHAVKPSSREYCISDAWTSQGYRIQRLRLLDRRVIFRREVHNKSGLSLPPALSDQRIPDDAVYEAKEFFRYLIKKYGL